MMNKVLVLIYVFIASLSFSQQTNYVDFKRANSMLSLDEETFSIKGKVWYKLDILKPIDSVYLDAKRMEFHDVLLKVNNANPKKVDYYNDGERFYVLNEFKKDSTYTIYFNYVAAPKKALYFVKRKDNWQIWTQGQGKYTSNWFPSIDDVNDKIIFNLSLTECSGRVVLSNGVQTANMPLQDNCIKYHFNMKQPMSSYLVALTVGDYDKIIEISDSRIPLEYYYYPEDSLKAESTYRYSKRMFDFLEDEIGYAYPWQNYKQVPVQDFLYAGMENTSLTIFSDAFVVDSIGFNDENYINVNAHELAHQWFGNLVTAKSGEHHWLQEGFATYYALLAERDIFGDNHFYFKLLESVLELSRQELSGNGTSLLNPKSSSLTFYQHGALVLHALRSKVGDKVYKQAVKNYLNKYQFSNVETSDFMKEVERLYGKSLATFTDLWIKQKAFPYEKAFELLKSQSTFVNEYAQVDCQAKSPKCSDYLKYYVSDEAKIKVISQDPELITSAVFNNSLKVRQAIAIHLKKIPLELKSEYESLLNDKSYITIEKALYNLWSSFPSERSKYLSKTRDINGFNDKGLRMLWLVLNLSTPFYEADNKQEVFNELINYTDQKFSAAIRMNAFSYLKIINSCNDTCKYNLHSAKSHHNWRMVKFAKEMTAQLEQNKQ